MTTEPSLINMYRQWVEYSLDFGQRAVLFANILRRRGNTYLQHLRQGNHRFWYLIWIVKVYDSVDNFNFEIWDFAYL
jgi:hypothetical protein